MKTATKYHSALSQQYPEKEWYSPFVDREKGAFLYPLELQNFAHFLEGNMAAWSIVAWVFSHPFVVSAQANPSFTTEKNLKINQIEAKLNLFK